MLRVRRSHASVLMLCIGAVLSFSAASAGAASDSFKGKLLPPATRYDALLVSSTNANTVFFGTENGLFETADGGRSWKPAGLGGEAVTSLSQIGHTILAGGRGLLAASSDGGKT